MIQRVFGLLPTLPLLALLSFAAGCGKTDGATATGKLYFSYGKMHELDMATGDLLDFGEGFSPTPMAAGDFVYLTALGKIVRGDRQGVTATTILAKCPYCDRLSVSRDEKFILHDTLDEIGGKSGIYIVIRKMDGTVVKAWEGFFDPAFLPNGGVVMTGSLGAMQGLYVSGPDHGPPKKIDTLVGEPRNPEVSPDGTLIAFAYQSHIWVMNVDGSNPKQITGEEEIYLGANSPTWSPDGATIAFRHGNAGGYVWIVPAAGGKAKPILNSVDKEWSSDPPLVWR